MHLFQKYLRNIALEIEPISPEYIFITVLSYRIQLK